MEIINCDGVAVAVETGAEANNVTKAFNAKIETLLSIVGHARPDQHAVRRRGESRWEYIKRSGEVTEDSLRGHLNGGPHLGVYLMAAGANVTRLATFDIDDHDGTLPWPEVQAAARKIMDAVRPAGFNPWPIRSGSGRGIHLHLFWEAPQPAAAVRAAMRKALADAGLKEGTAGLPAGEVEVFPKQDALADDGDGSLIALPFGRASAPLGNDLEPRDGPTLWVTSGVVAGPAKVKPARPEREPRNVDMDTVKDALTYLSPDEYDSWLRVGMALKLDVGEAAFPIWNEWSAKSDKYRGESDLRQKWRSFNRGEGAVVTMDAVFATARDAGWAGSSLLAPAFSDEDLALRFAAEHAGDLRFTSAWDRWHHWDGNRWRTDDTLSALDLARSHCRLAAGRANKRQAHIASARSSSSVLQLARADRRLAMRVDQWDRNPWLLATPAGTVDLRTGEIRAADPGDCLTRSSRVAPGGGCPLWQKTLHEIFPGNGGAKQIKFLQRWFGYSLTGSVREEKLLFLHGSGRNGKGTIVETIVWVMGDQATVIPTSALMQTKHPNHPTEIAKLCGARLAIGSETPQNARWNTEQVKLITGGDVLSGRFMRQDFFDFAPTHKLTITGNNLPYLGHVDVAIAARMLLLEFRASFADLGNMKLKEALRAEGSGILSWLIEGCLEWQRQGLAVPAAVREDTAEYLQKFDDVTMWLSECCVWEADPTGRLCTTSELLKSYSGWREQSGAAFITATAFPERLTALGLEVEKKRTHGVRRVRGIRLLSVIEEQERSERERRENEGAPF